MQNDEALQPPKPNTFDEEEVNTFSRLAGTWWNEGGEFKALHTLNYLRIPLIRDSFSPSEKLGRPRPLYGRSVLDVGCGGGLLSEVSANTK